MTIGNESVKHTSSTNMIGSRRNNWIGSRCRMAKALDTATEWFPLRIAFCRLDFSNGMSAFVLTVG